MFGKKKKEEKIEETKVEQPIEPETVETQPVNPVDEEPADEGVTTKLIVTQESFMEYVMAGSFKSQMKTAAIYSVIICLAFYLFRNKEQEMKYTLIVMAAGVVMVFAVETIFYFLQKKVIGPKQFKKNDLNGYGITITINNKGIKQLYNEKEYNMPWYKFTAGRETDLSFIFYGGQRSGMVLSKVELTEEQMIYIRNTAIEKVIGFKDERKKA